VQATLTDVAKKYGDDVRFVHKHNPLPMHNRALPAAIAAEAAGNQSKFWPMHDALFAAGVQRNLTDEAFVEIAEKLGLNVRRFKRDLEDKGLMRQIKQDQEQGAVLGARGTPAFFINGRFLSGAQPMDAFSGVIDDALDHARKLVRNGTPRKRVYERVIRDGKAKRD
jgi:protein-disulfide isomerase